MVTLDIAGHGALAMVLDTSAPLSSISEGSRDALVKSGVLEATGRSGYLLRNVSMQGQPIPNLALRISARATQVGADGLLGLDFFSRYTDIHFYVPSGRLTLTVP